MQSLKITLLLLASLYSSVHGLHQLQNENAPVTERAIVPFLEDHPELLRLGWRGNDRDHGHNSIAPPHHTGEEHYHAKHDGLKLLEAPEPRLALEYKKEPAHSVENENDAIVREMAKRHFRGTDHHNSPPGGLHIDLKHLKGHKEPLAIGWHGNDKVTHPPAPGHVANEPLWQEIQPKHPWSMVKLDANLESRLKNDAAMSKVRIEDAPEEARGQIYNPLHRDEPYALPWRPDWKHNDKPHDHNSIVPHQHIGGAHSVKDENDALVREMAKRHFRGTDHHHSPLGGLHIDLKDLKGHKEPLAIGSHGNDKVTHPPAPGHVANEPLWKEIQPKHPWSMVKLDADLESRLKNDAAMSKVHIEDAPEEPRGQIYNPPHRDEPYALPWRPDWKPEDAKGKKQIVPFVSPHIVDDDLKRLTAPEPRLLLTAPPPRLPIEAPEPRLLLTAPPPRLPIEAPPQRLLLEWHNGKKTTPKGKTVKVPTAGKATPKGKTVKVPTAGKSQKTISIKPNVVIDKPGNNSTLNLKELLANFLAQFRSKALRKKEPCVINHYHCHGAASKSSKKNTVREVHHHERIHEKKKNHHIHIESKDHHHSHHHESHHSHHHESRKSHHHHRRSGRFQAVMQQQPIMMAQQAPVMMAQQAPVMVAQQAAPVMAAQQAAPVMVAQQAAPVMAAQQAAPVMVAQQAAPVMMTTAAAAPVGAFVRCPTCPEDRRSSSCD